MEITINYSDEQFYSEELETLILRVLSKGAELQNVAEDAELSLLICDADTILSLPCSMLPGDGHGCRRTTGSCNQ